MWSGINKHLLSFAVISIAALLEARLCELGFDLVYAVSETEILFGVVLYSLLEGKSSLGWAGWAVESYLLEKAVSEI